jgi:hypothetical protein
VGQGTAVQKKQLPGLAGRAGQRSQQASLHPHVLIFRPLRDLGAGQIVQLEARQYFPGPHKGQRHRRRGAKTSVWGQIAHQHHIHAHQRQPRFLQRPGHAHRVVDPVAAHA